MKKTEKKKQEYKAKHNIYLSGNRLSENQIIIRGNKLNLRWFESCLLIWSDKDDKNPKAKRILELIEDELKKENA